MKNIFHFHYVRYNVGHYIHVNRLFIISNGIVNHKHYQRKCNDLIDEHIFLYIFEFLFLVSNFKQPQEARNNVVFCKISLIYCRFGAGSPKTRSYF